MKTSNYLSSLTFIITYIAIQVIHSITGLNYNFSDGLNIKLLIDFALWVILYCVINKVIKKLVK